ncbi:lantibiotic dehydratase [Microtetraspora sp. NBRC 16547]|uniref:lantibiotic dehydratase n=1 Tax=Microtetraspora sp. NBRC 16547 TaxID=3030993 RepID=UPI00255530CD|nr:lantibiotic dehydratase [Microtetraspora sp. NBRC 16547]
MKATDGEPPRKQPARQRRGTTHPFVACPAITGLGRIPLLPALPEAEAATRTIRDHLLAEGVFLASRQASAADPQSDRLAVTLRGYEIRARWRPTPHGIFAGVAPVGFHPRSAQLRLGEDHRARSNPSSAWLSAVSSLLVDEQGVLANLTLTANNLTVHRGDRLESELQGAPGGAGPSRITVRATEATISIMHLCQTGMSYGALTAEMTRRWPHASEQTVSAAVIGLVQAGFLLTDLLPDDITTDPLAHLTAKLPRAHPLRASLTRMRSLLAAADEHPPREVARLQALAAARDLADQIVFQERPLTVDVAADADLTLPEALAREAAEAAGVLWLVSEGHDQLTGFHDRFLDRYGPRRRVPLLEATDPATGLGLDFPDSVNSGSPARSTALAALYYRALASGANEVILNDADVQALSHPPDPTALAPRTAEIYVRVLADSEAELEAGRFRLATCPRGGSQDGGSTNGRFVSMLPDLRGGGDCAADALIAELVVAPRATGVRSLAVPTGLAPARIPVGVPAKAGDLPLTDLQLASDGRLLTVWSASRDQQVIPVLYSRLAPRLLPPLARFLQLAGRAGTRPWRTWSWGPFEDSPFQPRVRYGQTIIAPARWVLPPDLLASAHSSAAWRQALQEWKASMTPSPPDIVITDDADLRIPLDLHRPDDQEVLRRHARRGLIAVTEQPGGPGAVQAVLPGPMGRHVLEVSVPLARRPSRQEGRTPSDVSTRPAGQGLYLPGSTWLSLAIRSPQHCHDELLAGLALLADRHAVDVDHWFWLRYFTTAYGHHLRVRFHGHPTVLTGRLLPALSTWCSEKIAQRLAGGLIVEPYEQEIERYGGHASIQLAEVVFAADSRLVLTALAATRDPDQRLVFAALSAATIATTVADGDTSALGGRHLGRADRTRLSRLRPVVRDAYRNRTTPLLPQTHPAWTARQDALDSYRDTLNPQQRARCAFSLIHMHANRLLGGNVDEPLARALAADLLALPS